MKSIVFLFVGNLFFATSCFSQQFEKSDRLLDSLCNGKYFEKCEIAVDFRFGKKAMEDTVMKMLDVAASKLGNGAADFSFIVAKDGGVYEVRMVAGNIGFEKEIGNVLRKTDGLWTIGKQNARLVCSYVKLKVESIDNSLRLTLLKP